MTRDELIRKGIDENYIKEVVIFLDEMIEQTRFDDEESFFSDYCYDFDYPNYPFRVHYWITGNTGKGISVLVWAERVEQ